VDARENRGSVLPWAGWVRCPKTIPMRQGREIAPGLFLRIFRLSCFAPHEEPTCLGIKDKRIELLLVQLLRFLVRPLGPG
jgi:hypothetical protein